MSIYPLTILVVFHQIHIYLPSYYSRCVPVKYVVVGIAQLVEQTPEQLSQVCVVWLVLELE